MADASGHRWEYVAKGSTWETTANASVNYNYFLYGGAQTTTTVAEWHNPRSEGNFTRRLYNGLGQLVQEQTPYQGWTTNSGNEILVDHAYNALGQPTKVSVPHLTLTYKIGDNLYRGASYAAGVTTTAYDSLGRPTQTSAPNGEVTFYGYQSRASDSYTQDRTKTPNLADAYRLNQWQELDGLGYVANIRTWTHNGGINWTENARVIFTHDATGNLTSVTHPNGIGTTTMSYDLAGHKTAMNDVDLGNWRYAYDRQGKLTRQTDALGQTTCLYYENVLERVSGKLFQTNTSCPPSVGAYNITYQYDQNQGSTNRSRGQLTYVTKTGWNKQILYQAQGLLAEEIVNIQGAPQSYATYYGYDGYLRPNAIVYPDGEWATTTYNGMGLPVTLSSNWYGTLVDSAAYDVAGRLTQMRFPLGNNLWRSNLYANWTQNGSNGGRLSSIKVGPTAGQAGFLDEQYTYDSFGNIKTLFDNGNNYTFSYDAQNRLTNGYSQPYTYDSAGRLTNYEGYGLSAYAGHPHAMVNGASNYTFDANGNMKTRLGFQFFNWDAENHLSGMTSISGNESYLYDADGQRVKKTSNAGPVYYPNQFYEATVTSGVAAAEAVDPCATEPSPCPAAAATPSATTFVYLPWIQTAQQQPVHASAIGLPVPTKYYLFNGQRIAMRAYNVATNSSPITYLHSDHLGSVVLTSDGNANTAGSFGGQRFRAYGQGFGVYGPPYAPVPTDYGFTGQKSDGTGLVYMNARYYDPQLGQFISPDSEVPDATNVFDYNRYMYARGNPMKYTDPTGHCSSPSKTSADVDCQDYANELISGGYSTPGKMHDCDLNCASIEWSTWIGNKPYKQEVSRLQRQAEEEQRILAGLVATTANIRPILDKNGSIDPSATFDAGLGKALGTCGALVGGVCGVSYTLAGAASTPAGGKASFDFYADQNGARAAYATLAGGGAFVPSLVAVQVTGVSGMFAKNATVDNMAQWAGQFGGSSTAVGGPTVDWVFGSGWNGASIGGSGGAGVELHLNLSYSFLLYRSR